MQYAVSYIWVWGFLWSEYTMRVCIVILGDAVRICGFYFWCFGLKILLFFLLYEIKFVTLQSQLWGGNLCGCSQYEIGPIAQLVSSTWLIIRGSLVQAQVGPQRWMSLCWHPSFFCVYWQNNCCISVFFIEKHAFFVFWLSFCVNFSIKNI